MTASALTITVRYHGLLRQAAGRAQERLMLAAGASLRDSLEILAQEHGPALGTLLFDQEKALSSQFVMFRNGQLARRADGNLPLAEGDELTLFPRVSGG